MPSNEKVIFGLPASVRLAQAKHVTKCVAVPAVGLMALSTGAFAADVDVVDTTIDASEVVTSIKNLYKPIGLVGGAYVGLQVFKRGWKIIKGFI